MGKTSGADLRTKVNVMKANAHKYSVSAMCRVLQVNRSSYYYEATQRPDETGLSTEITEIFKTSHNNYGTRKIKKELMKTGKQVSRRRIGRIMKQEGLVSNYTTTQFKPQKDTCNESKTENILNRQFHTDRGNEFKNQTIEELLETFHIERSLSHKGCPYDNAVAEAAFKIIKTEFVWNETFANLSELKLKLWDYIHWYNVSVK